MIRPAPVLLPDEPTVGLDVESAVALEAYFQALVADGSRTVLLTSHELGMVQRLCQRVIIIQEGQVVADAPVSELVGLFRPRRYRCASAEPVPDDLPAELEQALPSRPRREERHWVVELDVDQPHVLYELLDVLRRFGCTIESITRHEPDLREACLRFVQGVRHRPPFPAPSGVAAQDSARPAAKKVEHRGDLA